MFRPGVQVSIAGGLDRAVDRALERGCDTFQIFTGNPRGWKERDLQTDSVSLFRHKVLESGMGPIAAHMPYLPNLASSRDDVYERSISALVREIQRCSLLGIPYLVTHLGSHLGSGRAEGLRRIVSGVEQALKAPDVTLLLENSAGTRNSIGGTFDEIHDLIDAIGSDMIGVCLDTCHLFVAGYDVRTPVEVAKTMSLFDRTVGLSWLKMIHLNDSRGGLNSRLDRHEHLGLGQIGEAGISAVLSHAAVRDLPVILETPVDSRRDDRGNLQLARRLALQAPEMWRG